MTDRVQHIIDRAAGVHEPLDSALCLPPETFHDDAWFELERRRVFDASWIAVCRSADVAEPNQYAAVTIAGEPVVVVRGRDGSLRALSNVCPHRNMTVVEGSGSVASLMCTYHLWTFRHDGQLLNAPHMGDDFDAAAVCLPQLGVEEWYGWVMVNVDASAPPLAGRMPTLEAYLDEYDIADTVHVGSLDYPHDWNWKITLENFNESYHHRGVHPDTLDGTFPGGQSIPLVAGDEPWSGLDHVSVVEGEEPFLVFVVYPTLLFSIIRGVGMLWFKTSPTAATHTDLTIEAHLNPDLAEVPDVADLVLQTVATINEEDIEINRRVAEGTRSRFAAPGAVSPLERSCWHFRRWLLDQVTDDST